MSLTNWSIVSNIIHLKNIKKLKVNLVKIKGHSGIWENDAADVLAKKGVNSKNFLISVKYPDINERVILLIFQLESLSTSEIDYHTKLIGHSTAMLGDYL